MIDAMSSSHRRLLLKQAASKERTIDCDVIAQIALDEIKELDELVQKVDVRTATNIDSHMNKHLKKEGK